MISFLRDEELLTEERIGRFSQAPPGRYIDFLSDFLAKEEGASREQALKAWKRLKKLDIPKDYPSWKGHTLSEA